jgi:Mg-chelatase subunit ChlI
VNKFQEKTMEKSKRVYLKEKLVTEDFLKKMTGRDFDLINTILKKLLNNNLKEAKRDIPDIFEALDGGNEIDLTNLEDDYVKAKLTKLFKLLLLIRSVENKLTFKKSNSLHTFSLKKLLEFMIHENEKEMSNYSGSDKEDDEDEEEESVSKQK